MSTEKKHAGEYGSKEYFRNRNRSANQQAHRRKWNSKNPATMRKINARQRKVNPSHVAARKQAQAEGKEGKKCRCGAAAVAAHHTSYDPPKHVWLCKKCHDKAHYTRPNVRRTLSARKSLLDTLKSLQGDKIPGGLADGKKPADFPAAKLAAGVKVEMEHTSSRAIATEIAMDHLTEDLNYYSKLKQVEKAGGSVSDPGLRVGDEDPATGMARRAMKRMPPHREGQALHDVLMTGGEAPRFTARTSNAEKSGPPGYPGRPNKVKLVVPASVNRPDHLGSPDHLGAPEHFSFSVPVAKGGVIVTSFGYDRKKPPEADLVVDVRGIATPKSCTFATNGKHGACQEDLLASAAVKSKIQNIVARAKSGHARTVAIGCSAGQHRSVAIAKEVARLLDGSVRNRDL